MSDSESIDPWLSTNSSNREPVIDENDLKFSDNFEPQLDKQITKQSSEESIFESLPDSQQYIKCLEKKLTKLKGQTTEMSTKHVMNCLSAKRDAILQQLLHSNDSNNYLNEFETQTHDSNITNNSTLYQLIERRLFPQTQALTEEELQKLLESDVLQKVTKNTELNE